VFAAATLLPLAIARLLPDALPDPDALPGPAPLPLAATVLEPLPAV
jgi:hypothetical protein